MLRWGLIPHWVDDPDDFKANLINARAETIDEKPSFKSSFKSRRCVIPASGFYEWKQENGSKKPYYIQPSSDEIFPFAGIWDTWKSEDGDERIHSCSIITKEANDELKSIHHRMPVVLDDDSTDRWLKLDLDTSEAEKILESQEPEDIRSYPVTDKVNSPSFNQEECIQPKE